MWLFTLAWAGPPEGVRTDDLARWETGATQMLAGPPGCWLFGGRVEVRIAGLPAANRTTRGAPELERYTGTFEGVIVDGTWQNLTYTLWSADDPTVPAPIDLPLLPTMGRFTGDIMFRTNPGANGIALQIDDGVKSLIGGVVQEMSTGGTAYAEWDEQRGAIELFQDVTLRGNKRYTVQVHTVFPGGGPATEVDMYFPRKMREGTFPFTVAYYDVQAHLRTTTIDGATLPISDSLSLGAAFFGITIGFEQSLTWERAARCGR